MEKKRPCRPFRAGLTLHLSRGFRPRLYCVALSALGVCFTLMNMSMGICLLTEPARAFQKPTLQPKAPMTDEEKAILKNREILENLDLLQDFEKFRYFDYFTAEEGLDKSTEANEPATKKESKKEEKREEKRKK
jgi:hypothetical protein